MSPKVMRTSACSSAMSARRVPGPPLEAAEALERQPTVGDAGQREDRLAHVHVAREGGTPVDLAVRRAELVQLDGRQERDPLRRRPELLGERPERAPLAVHGGVVALHRDELRHRRAGNRLALSPLPVAHLAERLRQLVGRVVEQRSGDEVGARAEVRLGELGEPLGDPAEDVEVGPRLPRGRHRLVERVDERMQVGRREVVLLVPGRGRAARRRSRAPTRSSGSRSS